MLQDFTATDARKLCSLGSCSNKRLDGKDVVCLEVEKRKCDTMVYLRENVRKQILKNPPIRPFLH